METKQLYTIDNMYETIKLELRAGTCIITINRPEKLNALSGTVIHELGMALSDAEKDPEIRSVLITGSGEKAFVAGADISEFPSMDSAGGRELAESGNEAVFARIEHFRKPVVAAVNGFALGGGCELAMACHFRTAAANARFGQPEVNLGLIPGYGGTQRLVHLVGKGRALEMLLTAKMVGAEEALQMGLVNHVFPQDSLIEKTLEILQTIHTKAPLAIEQCIALANLAVYEPDKGLKEEVKQFGALFDTADSKEGTDAFLNKRKAEFKGQ